MKEPSTKTYKMKKTNILYWSFTGLFALVMTLSAIPNILVMPDSVTMFSGLGYPTYLVPFLGVAKLLGAVTILIPGFSILKEWAYAGLFFDLTGATYSAIMVSGLLPEMAGMLIFFGLFALSYIYYHKRKRALSSQVRAHGSPVTA